jgi:hypothetical protein
MLCALTSPVPEARTDFGAIFPLIVAINFIFEVDEYAVGVSVAWLGDDRSKSVPTVTIEISGRFIPSS